MAAVVLGVTCAVDNDEADQICKQMRLAKEYYLAKAISAAISGNWGSFAIHDKGYRRSAHMYLGGGHFTAWQMEGILI